MWTPLIICVTLVLLTALALCAWLPYLKVRLRCAQDRGSDGLTAFTSSSEDGRTQCGGYPRRQGRASQENLAERRRRRIGQWLRFVRPTHRRPSRVGRLPLLRGEDTQASSVPGPLLCCVEPYAWLPCLNHLRGPAPEARKQVLSSQFDVPLLSKRARTASWTGLTLMRLT